MILITSSRRPTQLVRTLCNDLSRTIPNSVRVNRGKMSLGQLAMEASSHKADRVIIVEREKGLPSKILLFSIEEEKLVHFNPVIYIKGVKTQDQIGRKSRYLSGVALTISLEEGNIILKLANALSQFLRLKLVQNPIELQKFEASLHVSESKIAVTSPPKMNEIGPVLFLKKVMWQ
jgi:rRNA maturation protein Rpf1